MEKELYIDASHPTETRVVVKSNNHIEEYEYENKLKTHIKNNIYLGKVSRVEPSLQAAFINFGRKRHGFLAFNDIQTDYYQIPHDDKEKIKQKEEEIREQLKENEHLEEEKSESENLHPQEQSLEDQTNLDVGTNNNVREERKEESQIKKHLGNLKKYKIQEVIKPGQVLLIQVLKDERGLKGAALTTFISLAGKYSVLMPNTAKGGGISRKIFRPDDRKKIRSILKEIHIPRTMGLIVRTAGLNKTKNDIEKDLKSTLSIWENIKEKAVSSLAPSLIYEEGDIIKRTIRDICDESMKNIIVEGNDGFQKVKNTMKIFMPHNVKYIKKYKGKIPLFQSAGIEKNLNNIFESTLTLNSGGYIVINPTEALISIDVNSGRSIKEINVERTALATNLEAAEEISRQIKIRDLSGLIIIDFIDMLSYHNRRLVERKLREKLKNDRARIQFGRISNFGLLEMSRQRLRESSVNWKIVLSLESFSQKIVKSAQDLAFENKVKAVNLHVMKRAINFIKENYGDEISFLKKTYDLTINLIENNDLLIPEYKIELLKKKKVIKKIDFVEKMLDKTNKKENIINLKRMKKEKNKNRFFKNPKKKFKNRKFN
jgi:ribonuclease E